MPQRPEGWRIITDLHEPPLTISLGTQVVTCIAVRDADGSELALAGVVVAVPARVEGSYIAAAGTRALRES